jgi:hypothetical protein
MTTHHQLRARTASAFLPSSNLGRILSYYRSSCGSKLNRGERNMNYDRVPENQVPKELSKFHVAHVSSQG